MTDSHVSLVMLAFAMMAVIRRRANVTSPPKKMMLRLRTKQRS
jgi:SRSO17 transposase